MKIRKMCSGDCLQISEIEKNSFSSPWSYNSFLNELDNKLATYFVADYDGVIAGYVGVHNVCGEGEITMIATKEGFRGKGVASNLLKALIEHEKGAGVQLLNLEVREGNAAAIYLYNKFGFKTNGRRTNYYSSPTEDAILMTLNLIKED